MVSGTHAHDEDERNATILVHVNGRLVPREQAVVSVLDSGFILGDGVWEGLRLHRGRIAFLDAHLNRLMEGAKAIDLDIGKTRDELRALVVETIEANHMVDGVHIRLMVTRGLKKTPFRGTSANIGGQRDIL